MKRNLIIDISMKIIDKKLSRIPEYEHSEFLKENLLSSWKKRKRKDIFFWNFFVIFFMGIILIKPYKRKDFDKMKIFVWNKDFLTNWSSGMAIVIADDLEEARQILWDKMVEQGEDYERNRIDVFEKEPDEIHEFGKMAFYINGGA